MPPKKKRKTYIVRNPNHIPQGIGLIHWRGKEWCEGDAFEALPEMSIDRLLLEGYIEEVTDA